MWLLLLVDGWMDVYSLMPLGLPRLSFDDVLCFTKLNLVMIYVL